MTNRRTLDAALRTFMATYTTKQVGLAQVPTEEPTLPYAILYPQISPRGMGSWAKPEEDRECLFQVLSVGQSHEECAWMSDKVQDCIIGRAASGVWLVAMVIGGMTVQDRLSDSLGAIVRSGNKLFQCSDAYRLTVGA